MIFRDIKNGIKNLIKWFPIIWQDRDWDQYFIYVILKFKLEQMENLQRKYGHGLNSNDYADQMRVCINLLDRIIKDEYEENTFKHHDKKWGKADLVFKPLPDNDELSSVEIVRPKVITDEDKAQERKEWKGLHKHSVKLQGQDLDMLFLNMRKHIQGWWD